MPDGPLLELRHLHMIRAIARHGRVGDAAEALGLTASALSHRIREAERRLNVALYTRTHKRLRMTPAAELLVDVAERVLGELERAEADVRRMDTGADHVVRIAVETYSSYHWLPPFLARLRATAPGLDLQVMAAAGRDPLRALSSRHVDLVIASHVPRRPDLTALPLFEDALLYIMPPGHRHAEKAFVTADDIEGEPFITTSKTPAPDREFSRLFRPEERYPRWTTTVELPEAIVELVAAGQGTSVLAGWAVRPALEAGRIASARVGQDGLTVPWVLVLRAEDADAGPAWDVAALLRTWVNETGGLAGR